MMRKYLVFANSNKRRAEFKPKEKFQRIGRSLVEEVTFLLPYPMNITSVEIKQCREKI